MPSADQEPSTESRAAGPAGGFGSAIARMGLAVAVATLLLDQLTKWLIRDVVMTPPRVIHVIPSFNLTLVYNPGVSFGQMGWLGPWVLSVVAVAISVALVFWLRRAERPLLGLALGMIIGGALGNVIDRIRFGAVVDFLDFYVPGTNWPHWPAFNVADSAIVVGVGLILLDGLFAERKKIT